MSNEDPKKDKLAKLLNLNPLIIPEETETNLIEISPPETETEQIEGDFEAARDGLLKAVEVAQDAIVDLAGLAKNSQSARAYEVLAKLIDTMANASKDMLHIHQQKKDLLKTSDTPTNQTINNNLTLTTTEMLRIIQEKKNNGA